MGLSDYWPKVAHLVRCQAWTGTKALTPPHSHASLPPSLIYGSPLYTSELLSVYVLGMLHCLVERLKSKEWVFTFHFCPVPFPHFWAQTRC